MKKIIFIVLLVPVLLFSQNNRQDLYILYDENSIHKISETNTDTLDFEIYQIRFRDKIKSEMNFSVSKSGNLKEEMQISGKSYPLISITYLNKNNDNPPFKIKTDTISNKISANNIIYAKDTDFTSLFKNFKNIYLVDFNDKSTKNKIAKKVIVTFVSTL